MNTSFKRIDGPVTLEELENVKARLKLGPKMTKVIDFFIRNDNQATTGSRLEMSSLNYGTIDGINTRLRDNKAGLLVLSPQENNIGGFSSKEFKFYKVERLD